MIEITDHHDGLFRLRQGPAVSFIFSKADGEHMASQLQDLGMLPVSQLTVEEQRIAHIKTRQIAFERKIGRKVWYTSVENFFESYTQFGRLLASWTETHAAAYLVLCNELGITPNPNLYPPEMESLLDQL